MLVAGRTIKTQARPRPAPHARWRVWNRRHPETLTVGIVIVSWVALAVAHWVSHGSDVDSAWRHRPVSWTAMVVAMMLPGLLPMQRWVAFNSLWRRRQRAAMLFAATYVAVWIVVGAVAAVTVAGITNLATVAFDPGQGMVVAALMLAAAWQFSPAKRRALRRCHLRRPLATRGWAADRSVMAYGLFQARACVVSCGPAMVAMFISAHDFHLMVPLTAVLLYERLQRQPNEAAGAAALLATAAFSLVG